MQLHVKNIENERMREGMDSNLNSLKRLKVAVQKKFQQEALKKARQGLEDQKVKTKRALDLVEKTKEGLDMLREEARRAKELYQVSQATKATQHTFAYKDSETLGEKDSAIL